MSPYPLAAADAHHLMASLGASRASLRHLMAEEKVGKWETWETWETY